MIFLQGSLSPELTEQLIEVGEGIGFAILAVGLLIGGTNLRRGEQQASGVLENPRITLVSTGTLITTVVFSCLAVKHLW